MDYRYITIPEIKRVQLDYTTRCNALCLRCARNVDGKYLNKNMPLADMPWDLFKNFLKPIINTLNLVDICGNYGDPPLNPDLIRGCDWIINNQDIEKRSIANTDEELCIINIATNGGLNSTGWWEELAQTLNKPYDFGSFKEKYPGKVVFGFDGLEDTNHLYRRQVNWKKCMENSKAFINAGGRAEWQFIIFEHNAHQVEEAKKMAFDMGFKEFFTIGGYGRNETLWEAENPNEAIEGYSPMEQKGFGDETLGDRSEKGARTKKNQQVSLPYVKDKTADENLDTFKQNLKQYDNDIETFWEHAPIQCRWDKNADKHSAKNINDEMPGLQFMFNGEVWPCCEVGGLRFGKEQRPWTNQDPENEMAYQFYQETHGKYGSKFNNIYYNTLEEILNHEWFKNKLVQSWQHDFNGDNPRLQLCGFTCGKFN